MAPHRYAMTSRLLLLAVAASAFELTRDQIASFFEDGLAVVPDVLSEADVAAIEVEYDRCMNNEVPGLLQKMGKDFTDMSKPFGTPFEEFSVVNFMLPHRYHEPLRGNAFERVAAKIASQIFPGVEMVQDYDQLLDKRPDKDDAVFAMHQDMAYWPPAKMTANDTRTVTVTLAIDDETAANGCLRFVPGSQKPQTLRAHRPMAASREQPRINLPSTPVEEFLTSIYPSTPVEESAHR